jgi:multiple sugar transport system ATP-binding protein
MAEVVFDEVSKVFKDGTLAVDQLSLDIADGEFMVLVGPSGCGKTTALRMVGGLEEITQGKVRIGERIVNRAATSRWCSRAMRCIRTCRLQTTSASR